LIILKTPFCKILTQNVLIIPLNYFFFKLPPGTNRLSCYQIKLIFQTNISQIRSILRVAHNGMVCYQHDSTSSLCSFSQGPTISSQGLLVDDVVGAAPKNMEESGSCHKRQKPQAPTPQAPIRNRQTRKVVNAKGLDRNTNLT